MLMTVRGHSCHAPQGQGGTQCSVPPVTPLPSTELLHPWRQMHLLLLALLTGQGRALQTGRADACSHRPPFRLAR